MADIIMKEKELPETDEPPKKKERSQIYKAMKACMTPGQEHPQRLRRLASRASKDDKMLILKSIPNEYAKEHMFEEVAESFILALIMGDKESRDIKGSRFKKILDSLPDNSVMAAMLSMHGAGDVVTAATWADLKLDGVRPPKTPAAKRSKRTETEPVQPLTLASTSSMVPAPAPMPIPMPAPTLTLPPSQQTLIDLSDENL
jgi:hypothetical protein